MQVSEFLTGKAIRYAAATIFLGAIGSGAWEWVLKPAFVGLTDFGLNVATLGVQSFKDSLYKEIARGHHEEPSLQIYVAIFLLGPCLLISAVSGFMAGRRQAERSKDPSRIDKTANALKWPMLGGLLFVAAFSMIQANQLMYENRAITHFEQLMAITAPTLKPDEVTKIKSRFAQIASSSQYRILESELQAVCAQQKATCPSFAVW